MLPLAFALAGWGFLLPALVGVSSGRLSNTHFNGWAVIANVLFGISSALNGMPFFVCFHAAVAAWSAWIWWNGGGGDGTRRRLRSWGRRFQGVRRTAPSHA
jgi:ABC-type dipeptide/oligopeptide/nickel transport system permease component